MFVIHPYVDNEYLNIDTQHKKLRIVERNQSHNQSRSLLFYRPFSDWFRIFSLHRIRGRIVYNFALSTARRFRMCIDNFETFLFT